MSEEPEMIPDWLGIYYQLFQWKENNFLRYVASVWCFLWFCHYLLCDEDDILLLVTWKGLCLDVHQLV